MKKVILSVGILSYLFLSNAFGSIGYIVKNLETAPGQDLHIAIVIDEVAKAVQSSSEGKEWKCTTVEVACGEDSSEKINACFLFTGSLENIFSSKASAKLSCEDVDYLRKQ